MHNRRVTLPKLHALKDIEGVLYIIGGILQCKGITAEHECGGNKAHKSI